MSVINLGLLFSLICNQIQFLGSRAQRQIRKGKRKVNVLYPFSQKKSKNRIFFFLVDFIMKSEMFERIASFLFLLVLTPYCKCVFQCCQIDPTRLLPAKKSRALPSRCQRANLDRGSFHTNTAYLTTVKITSSWTGKVLAGQSWEGTGPEHRTKGTS